MNSWVSITSKYYYCHLILAAPTRENLRGRHCRVTTINQFASTAAAASATNVSSLKFSAAKSFTSAQVRAQLASASLPAVASRLQDKPSTAENGGSWGGSPHLRLKS
jgi:hypothetical protein